MWEESDKLIIRNKRGKKKIKEKIEKGNIINNITKNN